MTTDSLAALRAERERCRGLARLVMEAALMRDVSDETRAELETMGTVIVSLIGQGVPYDAKAKRALQPVAKAAGKVDA